MTQEQLGLGFEPFDQPAPIQDKVSAVAPRKRQPRATGTARPVEPAGSTSIALTPPPTPDRSSPKHTDNAGVVPEGALALDMTAAAMAQVLERHPDYRVLRRLVPTLHFEGEPTGQVRHLLVLDTETTGLDSSKDKVIELALLRVAVDSATGLPVGEVQVYDGLEDPGRPIPPAITDITGITNDMVRGQQLDMARIANLMQGVDMVVAHNAGFDRPFVEARLPAFAQLPWACSLADLDWKKWGQSSARLESLALACGWFYDAHRAETDCHALLAVLSQPLRGFGTPHAGDAGDSGASASVLANGLAGLLQAVEQTHHRLQATGAPFDAKDSLKARGYRWDAQQRVWGTMLRSETALADELAWLASEVYVGRATRVRVEALSALERFSGRNGTPTMQLVGAGPLGL